MGHQQLLLVILGVVLVGIAVAVGFSMFSDNAVSANRDAVSDDLISLAGRAQQYYHRSKTEGGGGNSFIGLTADAAGLQKLTSLPDGKDGNGTYSIIVAGTANAVALEGIGLETASDGSPVTMEIYVRDGGRPDSLVIVH